MAKGDSDAIIVATIGDNGVAEHVWRYRGRQFELAEAHIVRLTKAGKRVRVTFLEVANDGLDDEQRAALEELVP